MKENVFWYCSRHNVFCDAAGGGGGGGSELGEDGADGRSRGGINSSSVQIRIL